MKHLITILVFIAPLMCSAQKNKNRLAKDTTKNEVFGLYYFFSLEKPIIDNSEANTLLRAKKMPEAIYPTLAIGMGIEWQINKSIVTIGYNGTRKTQKSDTATTRVSYRSFSINFGYDVIKSPYVSLYPYAGIKSGVTKYLFRENGTDTSSFSNYFNQTMDYKDINSQRLHFDLGMGVSIQSWWLMNLRGGILLPLGRENWYINKTKLPGAPQTRYIGYITLNIGFGDFMRENKGRRENSSNTPRIALR